MSGGAAVNTAREPISEVDQQAYIEELRGTLVAHRLAVRGVFDQATAKLEGLQRDHIDQQERLLRRLRGGSSGAPGAPDEGEASELEGIQASLPLSWSTLEADAARKAQRSHNLLPRTSQPRGRVVLHGAPDAPSAKPVGSEKSACAGIAWDSPRQPGAVDGEPPELAQQHGAARELGNSSPGANDSVTLSRSLGLPQVASNVRRTSTLQYSGSPSRSRMINTRASGFSMLSDCLLSLDGERGVIGSRVRQAVNIVMMLIEHTRQRVSKEETMTKRIVKGWVFKTITTAAILLNALCIGIQTNYSLALALDFEEDEDAAQAWMWLECVFTVFFAAELLLRAVAERIEFLIGKNWKWNFFDTILVSTSVVGLLAEALQSSGERPPDFSFARMLRLIRFTRVLRLLRAVRFSESLRLMIFAILASIGSLFWIWIVLFFMIYFWAVFFLSGIIEHYTDDSSAQFVAVDLVRVHFGSLLQAVLSLFMCITGGRDWFDVVEPLWEISPWYTLAFSVYIFFMTLGVLNVVVGSFVDNAQQVSRNDREMVVKNEIKQEREYMARVRDIFSEADKDADGSLSWEEFEDYLQDDRVAAYLGSLGLDSSIAKTLFVLLDVDDTNSVGIDEFVGGCLRLKGQARSIDVNMLLYNSEKMICKTTDSMEAISRRLDMLANHMGLESPVCTPRSGPEVHASGSKRRPIARGATNIGYSQDLAGPPGDARPQSANSRRSGPLVFSHRDASVAPHADHRRGESPIPTGSFDMLLPSD